MALATTTVVNHANVIVTTTGTLTLGTLQMSTGSLLTGIGTLNGNLIVNGGPVQVPSETDSLTVTGDYTQIAGTFSGAGALRVNGMLTWSGGTMSGSGGHGRTEAADGMTITGIADKVLDGRTLINIGAATWTDFGDVRFSNGAVFNNTSSATLDAQNDAGFLQSGGAAGLFANAGIFRKSATNDPTFATTIGVTFSNPGTVQAQVGTINLTGSFTNFAGTTLTGGTYVVTGTLKFTNANIVTNAATIVLDGAASQIINQSNADALANFATNAAAGRFTLQNGRNFTTVDGFTNAGYLGDDILHKIDEGLAHSQFGIVIFSPHFFAAKKKWTPREYSGLVAREDVDNSKRIIPVWHEITKDELYKKSPTIVNRLALRAADLSVPEMAKKIAKRVRDGSGS